jgi:type II secretory pathway pseudopilin PulG
MKRSSHRTGAFSLVEVALALGVAAFCFVAVLGMLPVGLKTQQAGVNQTKANAVMSQAIDFLRADVRLPPGQAKNSQGDWTTLNGHWGAPVHVPDTLYFTNDAIEINGSINQSTAPPDAVYRATITYLFPPTATTSIAKITVSWPAAQSDLTKAAGLIDMFAAVNR